MLRTHELDDVLVSIALDPSHRYIHVVWSKLVRTSISSPSTTLEPLTRMDGSIQRLVEEYKGLVVGKALVLTAITCQSFFMVGWQI